VGLSATDDRLTIVTVCMNRRQHLRVTAVRVAAWPWHQQHLILDWSSDRPLQRDELPADPRVRLERVEGEREWNLSRAYNAAIGLATDATWILKLDADCWPTAAWSNPLAGLCANSLLIGEGPEGRNGQFLVARSVFQGAGGFHELMRGWGFDDKDLRLRLERLHGCQLQRLSEAAIGVIHHDDGLRAGMGPGEPRWSASGSYRRSLAEARIRASMLANRLVSANAPWGQAAAACCYDFDGVAWRLRPGTLPKLPGAAAREVADARRIVFWARFLAIPEVLIEQMPFSLFPAGPLVPPVRWWHRLYWQIVRPLFKVPASLLIVGRISLLSILRCRLFSGNR
jgi:hypothetical protein